MRKPNRAVPDLTYGRLSQLVTALSEPLLDGRLVETLLEDVCRLQVSVVAQAEREIAELLGAPLRTAPVPVTGTARFFDLFRPQRVAERAIQVHRTRLIETPRLAWLFLFHGNGHLRQAALEVIDQPIESPFLFAAIANRLNDWAEPVSIAAGRCADRIFPTTSPKVIAEAALALLLRKQEWGRSRVAVASLDAAFTRADVTAEIALLLRSRTAGPLTRILGRTLKLGTMDPFLPELAFNARQPTVRAMGLRALIDRRATWVEGYGQEWVDKRFGITRRVPILGQRALQCDIAVERLIRVGADDPSSAVREVAAERLVSFRHRISGLEDVIEKLANDPRRNVRQHIDFLKRAGAERL